MQAGRRARDSHDWEESISEEDAGIQHSIKAEETEKRITTVRKSQGAYLGEAFLWDWVGEIGRGKSHRPINVATRGGLEEEKF